MIFEHEIPSGSRLYFGKSAKLKRAIESSAGDTLMQLGFEEIVTPIFSYHQHESFEGLQPLIRLNDAENHEITLRADSTVDVVRIVTKRLGRSMESKKWFYIQPTVTYPTSEQYQIGAEVIDGSFEEAAKTTVAILSGLDIAPTLQLANICIPHLLNDRYGISLDLLRSTNVEKILKADIPWIDRLVRIHDIKDLDDLSMFPGDIAGELQKIKEAADNISYPKTIISPLYYAKMRYYKSLTFKMFEENSLLAMGGVYMVGDISAAGFALYTDECIANKMNREDR
jgi:hypothetical protein